MLEPISSGAEADRERRQPGQPADRKSGLVVLLNGSRATVAARMADLVTDAHQFWSIGDLVAIYGPKSRVVCLVQDMAAANLIWDPRSDNFVNANVELLGEVIDGPDGKPLFRRGIAHYPPLGSPVNRIRQEDLVAIYDLGDRKSSVIGQLVQAKIPAAVDIEAMLRRHFAVVGTTGVGKSTSVAILLRQSIKDRPGLRVVILDPHNEYSHAFKDEASTVDASRFELPFWLFHFDEFVEVIYRGAPPPAEEVEFLREAISIARDAYATPTERSGSLMRKAYKSEGAGSDAPRPYRIHDVLAAIEAEVGRLDPRHNRFALRSLKTRLEAISNDPSFRFMFGKAAIEAQPEFVARSLFRLGEVSKPVTILQMAGIPSDVVNASVSVLARLAFDMCVAQRGHQEILLVCEEAHRYVPADVGLGFGPTRRAIARIAKEGRKYGCYLGIITQRPAELDATILSQCSTIFAMRLSNAADQEIMRSAIPDNSAGALEFISALNNREAIAFGEAVATGMRLKFMNVEESYLPRMTLDPVEHAPEPVYVEPVAAPEPSIQDRISAPAFHGGRVARPADTLAATGDWPSSDRARTFGVR